MTVVAQICAEYVQWSLSGRINAVVAGHAVANYVHMVEVCRHPCVGRVAVIAVVAAGDMVDVLAFGDYAIVATDTVAENLGVIDGNNRLPDIR